MGSFSEIKGDRSQLNASGQDLARAAKELAEVTHVLNGKVKDLVGDAGWSGAAADAFNQDWQQASAAGASIAQAMGKISTAMELLAAGLSEAQSDLEDAKDYAKSQGIKLGPAGDPVPMSLSPVVTEYLNRANRAVAKAEQARGGAAKVFSDIVTSLAPGGKDGDTLGLSDKITLADAARTLYGIPAARTALQRENIEKLEGLKKDMKRLQRHIPKGTKEYRLQQEARLRNRQLIRTMNKDLAQLESSEAKWWKPSGNFEMSFAGLREKLHIDTHMKVIDSFPVVGTVVGVGGAGLAVKDDMSKGWGFWHSVGVEGGTTLASMILAPAAEETVTDSFGVTAGVAMGVGFAYGVGTYGDELFKSGHWENNIHQHGVLSGVGHSLGDAGRTWWQNDAKGLFENTGNTVKSVWRVVF